MNISTGALRAIRSVKGTCARTNNCFRRKGKAQAVLACSRLAKCFTKGFAKPRSKSADLAGFAGYPAEQEQFSRSLICAGTEFPDQLYAPAALSWSGIRHSPREAAGFFEGIAAEHADPKLEMTEFFENNDAVAAFGRYQATVKASDIRVDTPVAHYFKFRDGKVSRYVNIVNSGAFVEAGRMSAASAR